MPDPNSARVMRAIDAMTPGFRALVHEFGFVIVDRMVADGYSDAHALRPVLEGWRERRQGEWLATDYLIPQQAFGGLVSRGLVSRETRLRRRKMMRCA